MMKTKHTYSGFTLIELMIVLAIVGVLASFSIPAYQNYVVRVKIAEGFQLFSTHKATIWENIVQQGVLPSKNSDAGLPPPSEINGDWVESVALGTVPTRGSITITYKNSEFPQLKGKNTIVFVPDSVAGSMEWRCNEGTVPMKFRPDRCRK